MVDTTVLGGQLDEQAEKLEAEARKLRAAADVLLDRQGQGEPKPPPDAHRETDKAMAQEIEALREQVRVTRDERDEARGAAQKVAEAIKKRWPELADAVLAAEPDDVVRVIKDLTHDGDGLEQTVQDLRQQVVGLRNERDRLVARAGATGKHDQDMENQRDLARARVKELEAQLAAKERELEQVMDEVSDPGSASAVVVTRVPDPPDDESQVFRTKLRRQNASSNTLILTVGGAARAPLVSKIGSIFDLYVHEGVLIARESTATEVSMPGGRPTTGVTTRPMDEPEVEPEPEPEQRAPEEQPEYPDPDDITEAMVRDVFRELGEANTRDVARALNIPLDTSGGGATPEGAPSWSSYKRVISAFMEKLTERGTLKREGPERGPNVKWVFQKPTDPGAAAKIDMERREREPVTAHDASGGPVAGTGSGPKLTHPDVRALVSAAESAGASWRIASNSHVEVTIPGGHPPKVLISNTPSDRRSVLNDKARLRKAGLKVA